MINKGASSPSTEQKNIHPYWVSQRFQDAFASRSYFWSQETERGVTLNPLFHTLAMVLTPTTLWHSPNDRAN
jgi:hypothetical protein